MRSSFGTWSFRGIANVVAVDAAAGQVVSFHLEADASIRYGWNILDPGDDWEWESSWSATARSTPPRVFQDGRQTFVAEARDGAGRVTRVEIRITVHAFVPRHALLFVDDSVYLQSQDEQLEDSRWNAVFEALRVGAPGFDFDPARDVYDVEAQRHEPPPLALLFDYAVVVWAVVEGAPESALRRVGRFRDPFVARYAGAPPQRNDLALYLDNGGALWICGDRPAHVLWPVSDEPDPARRLPLCIADWDDPIEPHPGIDSVGVNSLLWRMGVECFDLGSGLGSTRPQLPQGCRGLLPAPAASGAPRLATGVAWPLPRDPALNPLGVRPNVEIYNMTILGGDRQTDAVSAYVYASGVPADPPGGISYPLTADGMPALVLAKRDAGQPTDTRALCSIEPWRLDLPSHEALARWVLLERFALGLSGAAWSPSK